MVCISQILGKNRLETVKIQNYGEICSVKKICAILPSYNEEKNIPGVIKGVLKNNIDVVVVDDGSVDGTSELAKRNGAVVIRHDRKKGKGTSLKDGLTWATSNAYDYIITIDSDGQHNPQEIPLFIKKADADAKVGVVIGNRLLNPKNMPFVRFCTNKFMSYLISTLCKQDIPDTQCGYKLIKKDVLKVISIKARKFEIESELLVKTARAGFKISSIPIESIYAEEKSKIDPFIDTIRFIKFLVKTLIKK